MNLHRLWQRSEWTLSSDESYANPLQDATLSAVFTAPSGKQHDVYGFWDGGTTWRLRFAPDEVGAWSFATHCSDVHNQGLQQQGTFECVEVEGKIRFQRHGPIRVASNRHHFEHADGTPFFWLADTCRNGPLLATPEDWAYYLAT